MKGDFEKVTAAESPGRIRKSPAANRIRQEVLPLCAAWRWDMDGRNGRK